MSSALSSAQGSAPAVAAPSAAPSAPTPAAAAATGAAAPAKSDATTSSSSSSAPIAAVAATMSGLAISGSPFVGNDPVLNIPSKHAAHSLNYQPHAVNRTCDMCEQPSAEGYQCQPCGYDLCITCVDLLRSGGDVTLPMGRTPLAPLGRIMIRNSNHKNLELSEAKVDGKTPSVYFRLEVVGEGVYISHFTVNRRLSASDDRKSVTFTANRSASEKFKVVPVAVPVETRSGPVAVPAGQLPGSYNWHIVAANGQYVVQHGTVLVQSPTAGEPWQFIPAR